MSKLRWSMALVVLALALVMPQAASASIQPGPTAASNPTYIGWGTIRDGRCDYSQSWQCFETSYVSAWRWSGAAWSEDYRAVGQRVYVYPYVKGWTWTWTAGSGWLATDSRNVSVPGRF